MKKNVSPLKFMFSFMKPYALPLIIAFICSLFYVASNIYIPIASGWALDYMLETVDFTRIVYIILSILGMMLIGSLFYWILAYLSSSVSYKIARDMRNAAFNKILYTHLSVIDNTKYGDIMSTLINDISIIQEGIIQTFIQLFTGFFMIVATLVMMFIFSWQLALIVFLLTPLSIIFATIIAKGTAKTFALQSSYRGKLSALANEHIENQKVIIASDHQLQAENDFDEIAKVLKKHDMKASFYSSVINPTTRLINSIIYGVVVVVGAIFILDDIIALTTGALMTYLMFTNNYTNPFNEVSEVISQLQTAYASSKRVQDLVNFKEVEDGELIINHVGDLVFDHVNFSYVKDKPIIKDMSFTIKEGSHVAIVGKTGCGKTTLINLIMKFYQPDSGSILIDGKNINEINANSLRSSIGMVLQDTWIFHGTILENIKYANDLASEEEILKTSKMSGSKYFIDQMDKGFESVVSNTSGLSSGQKQLLCINRLMLNPKEMLILDEATSNIDTVNEKLIQKDFDEMMTGKTSIVIAHRLSTIVNSDKILMLDDGRLIEEGSHEELMKKKGEYYKLYQTQFANN